MADRISIPLYIKHGFYWCICNHGSFTKTLVTYYMINYYIKYVELIDTVFLVLKKKPLGKHHRVAWRTFRRLALLADLGATDGRRDKTELTGTAFLHVFHHSATAVLCYTQLNGETSVQWVVITLNLLVHVLMYYYYWATAGGRKIWWKKYLTTMQITQFIIDLCIVYFATTNHFFTKWGINLPWVADCAGAESAATFGCAILTSYLFLFISFYRKTYKGGAKKANGAKKIN